MRAEVDPWGTVEDIDDHRCLLRMATDTLGSPAIAIGAIGADFEIRSRPKLVDYIRDWGDIFIRAAHPRQEAPSSARIPSRSP